MNIWDDCDGAKHIAYMELEAVRVVESQSYIATRRLVDSDEEQLLLEQMIDNTKPDYPQEKKCTNMHYLLATPFRYPPLLFGSRFGHKSERGIFYASSSLQTSFSEAAYYRRVFMQHTEAKLAPSMIGYTTFWTDIATKKGIELTCLPFNRYEKMISDPTSHEVSQALGSHMRNAGVEAFTFTSARCKDQGENIALFTPRAFKSLVPKKIQQWDCYVDQSTVSFHSRMEVARYSFASSSR